MKKYAIAAVVAVVVSAGAAFAASLQVNAGTLQAGNDNIDSCIVAPDEVVSVTYGEPEFLNGSWVVDEIALDDDSNCTGLDFSVVVTGGSWETSTQTGAFGESPVTVTFPTPFDADEASDVHIAIRSAAS